MAEEHTVLQEVREYRQRRDGGMEVEGEEEWKDDGQLLYKAVEDGDMDVVQYLVEDVGVSVEVADRNGWRPLHVAAWNGRLAVGQYLVVEGGADMEAGAEDGTRPFHYAALKGHEAFVEWLSEQGASAEGRMGIRPLDLAAGHVHPSVVRCLLQHFAGSIGVNVQDRYGTTALHIAAGAVFALVHQEEDDVLGVVRLLVEEGEADPLLRNTRGERASDFARDMEYSQVEKYLLEAEEMAEMQKQA